MRSLTFLVTTITVFFGCASSVVMRPNDNNSNYNARVCIIRPQMRLGAGVTAPILIENKEIMKLRTKTYAYWPVAPGNYTFQILPGNMKGIITPTQISVEIKDNETKYIMLKENIIKEEDHYKASYDPFEIQETEAISIISKFRLIKPK